MENRYGLPVATATYYQMLSGFQQHRFVFSLFYESEALKAAVSGWAALLLHAEDLDSGLLHC